MLCSPPIILLDEPSKGMDPESKRFMWSMINKLSKINRKSSVILTTHLMEEAETLCKRMGIMVKGEFVCLGTAEEIKNKYGYGYELNIKIKPLSEDLEEELFFSKYNIDKRMKVNKNNIENILKLISKTNYIDEIKVGRLGEKLIKRIEKSDDISINSLLSWIFYVQNALKFINYGKDNFEEIMVEENIGNSFVFKMKKKKENNKSIGYLFSLFETYKEECYITEYSLQQTSLEEIFNKFAENYYFQLKEDLNTEIKPEYVDNNIIDDEIMTKSPQLKIKKYIINEEIAKKLLSNE